MQKLIVEPAQIEAQSFAMIEQVLGALPLTPAQRQILIRVIHTTADFDYAQNLCFSPGAVEEAAEALRRGAHIVTDTNMALAGVNKRLLHALGGEAHCFMADADVAEQAMARQVTRAVLSMEKAARLNAPLIFAVGNAPTALLALEGLMQAGQLAPVLIIAVPVGFVNVVEAKQRIMAAHAPYICAAGRKGGSPVAAAICNALLKIACAD